MDFNENKSFEDIIKDKVGQHEFPFESSSWAAMQSKLQAQQNLAAEKQSTLYKSILLNTGKFLVALISISAIIYSALSLSGMLDKNEKSIVAAVQENAVSEENLQAKNYKSTSRGNGFEVEKDDFSNNNVTQKNTGFENEINVEPGATSNNIKEIFASKKVNSASKTKHFSGNSNMQKTSNSSLERSNRTNIAKAEKKSDLNVKNATNIFDIPEEKSLVISGSEPGSNSSIIKENPYTGIEKNAFGNEVLATETQQKTELLEANETIVTENSAAVDSAMEMANNGMKYPEKPSEKPKAKMLLSFSGGINLSNLSKTENGNTTKNISASPMLGVNVSLPLSQKIAFQAGAQYVSYEVGNVNHSREVVEYNILQSSTITKTIISRCSYIEFPVLLKYALIPRVNVFSGLRTGLLIGANATQTINHYNSAGELTSSNEVNEVEKIARFDGLRSVDFGLPLGLEIAAGRKLSLSLARNIGLTDFTYNSVFKDQKDVHSSWQIQVNYRPFIKK